MVHQSAPLRLTGAFGVMLLVAGIATIGHYVLADHTPFALIGAAIAVGIGGGVLVRRDRLTFAQIGWLAIACTLLVSITVAARDTPYGAGYSYVWGAPFAFAAGRRAAAAMLGVVAVGLAVAFAVQAGHVDDPLAFRTYFAWWLTATVTVAVVGAITMLILDSLQATQRGLDESFDRGILGMAFLDVAGRFERVNPALGRILDRDPASLAGTPVSEVTHPDDQAFTLENLTQVVEDGQVVADKRFVRPDGSARWVTVHATILRDRHGAPSGMFAEYEDITARREAEASMRESERRFQRAYEDAGVGMLLLELDGTIVKANAAAGRLFGAPAADVVGTSIARWQHPDDRGTGKRAAQALISNTAPDTYERDVRYVTADGRIVHAAATAALVRDDDGAPAYTIVQLADVTARVTARRREQALADLGRQGLGAAGVAALLKDAPRVVAETLDVSFATLLDGSGADVLGAHGWDGAAAADHARAVLDAPDPVVLEHAATELRFPTRALLEAGVITGAAVPVDGEGDAPFAVLAVHAGAGEHRFDADDVAFLRSAANVLTAALRRDAAERELRHRALHDPLTRLPNRALLTDRLRHALARARRERRSVAALFLDVDDFKDVNDRHGHEGGDALLQALAPRLQAALRANDTLARFGADEFVVLCEDLADPEEALSVADRLLEACATPIAIGHGHAVRRTASIGVALSGGADGDDADTLLRDADLAMHRAKIAGKGRYEVFAHAMRELALERVALLADLDRALAEDELTLHFQPIVDLRDGTVQGAESLVRWHHPERGTIMPDEFIGLAERTGRIVELGRWVLRHAASQAGRWPDMVVGINVSRLQLGDTGFVDDVAHALAEHGVAPSRFTIEVTETALMEDPAAAESTLLALRDLGVKIALDDFGTGYSSLSSVSDFPLDTLKLDRAFLADHRPEAQRWSIVRAVLEMSRSLDLEVVVEGIETEVQRAQLAGLGAVLGQGYLFSRPLPAERLEPQMLKTRRALPPR